MIKTDKIHSPVDTSGLRIVPNTLYNYIQMHDLTLACFHAIPWVVQGHGHWARYAFAGCSKTWKQDRILYKGLYQIFHPTTWGNI